VDGKVAAEATVTCRLVPRNASAAENAVEES